MSVKFRKLSFGEWVLRDCFAKALETGLSFAAIMAWQAFGWLAYVGIPDFSWEKGLAAASLIAIWPKDSVSRYEEIGE